MKKTFMVLWLLIVLGAGSAGASDWVVALYAIQDSSTDAGHLSQLVSGFRDMHGVGVYAQEFENQASGKVARYIGDAGLWTELEQVGSAGTVDPGDPAVFADFLAWLLIAFLVVKMILDFASSEKMATDLERLKQGLILVQGKLDTLETRIEDGDIIAAKAKEADFATETDLALRALVADVADRALETDRALTAGTADLALYANTSGSAKTADNATHADKATYADTAGTADDGQPDPADPGSGEEWKECARGISNYGVAGAVLAGWPGVNVVLEWDSSIKAEVWEVLRKSTGAASKYTTSEITTWRSKRGELIAGRIDNGLTGYSFSNVKEARLIELARSLGAKLLGASGGGGGEVTAGGQHYPEASNPDKWLDLEVIWYRR